MTRMARALTLRGQVTPFPLNRSPLTPYIIDRGSSGNMLHLLTERCVLLNEAFQVQIARLSTRRSSPRPTLDPSSCLARWCPDEAATPAEQRAVVPSRDRNRPAERVAVRRTVVFLLHPDNDEASDPEWDLNSIIDGTNLATGETIAYSPQSVQGIAMRTELMASQRAASFRFYLNDITFARSSPSFGLGALRVTVAIPVKLRAVMFQDDGTARTANTMISPTRHRPPSQRVRGQRRRRWTSRPGL